MLNEDNKIGPKQQIQFFQNLQKILSGKYSHLVERFEQIEPDIIENLPARLKVFATGNALKTLQEKLSDQMLELGISIENRFHHLMIDIDEVVFLGKRELAQKGISLNGYGAQEGVKSFRLLLIALGFSHAKVTEQEGDNSRLLVELCTEHKCIQLMYALDDYKNNSVTYFQTGNLLEITIDPTVNYQRFAPERPKPIDRLAIADFNKMSKAGKVRFLIDYLDPEILSDVLKNIAAEKEEVFQEASQETLKEKIDSMGLVLVKKDEPVEIKGTSVVAKEVSIEKIFTS